MNYGITNQITRDGLINLVWTCLTSGSIGYGFVSIDCEDAEYQAAKNRLIVRSGERPCVEDIFCEVLRGGDSLQVFEDSTMEGLVSIEDLHGNFKKVEGHLIADMMNERDDADTHDAILQCLLLGGIVYG